MSVYFATSGRYTKIGYSKKPWNRAATLTTNGMRPDDLPRGAHVDLIGWIPGNQWIETKFHGRFTGQRVKGEWFVIDDQAEVDRIIWDDPAGIHMQQMSGFAVMAGMKYPGVPRIAIASAGIQIRASTPEEARAAFDRRFNGALDGLLGGRSA